MRPAPEELTVDLVNGWSPSVRREAGLTDDPLPSVHELLTRHGYDCEAIPATGSLVGLAESLHDVFAAPAADRRRAILNDLIPKVSPTPTVAVDGPRWCVRRERELQAATILSLVEHARHDPDLARLGICAAHRCVDAYVDRSQGRVRRYCSLTCQNRAKALALRQRRATAQAASDPHG